MRSFGERPLSVAATGLTGNSRGEVAQLRRVSKQKVLMTCVSCEKEKEVTQGKLHKYYKDKDYTCYDCSVEKRAQDKKEMNQALINLARSKGLIK